MILLFLAACATALATGLGALPVYALGSHTERLTAALWGTVAGVMTVASIQGLLLPGLREGSDLGVVGGAAAGVAFLVWAKHVLELRDMRIGTAGAAGSRRALLVFGVLFVHSLPEGFALGAAWASGSASLSIFIFVAIAVQNIPEGTATAIPLREAGIGPHRAFWAATLTSAPQPFGALLAFVAVESVRSLLPISFGFAAGAMLALVAIEVLPMISAPANRRGGLIGAAAGATVMVALGLALGVD